MSLSTLMVLETIVDLATVALSLLVIHRYLPLTWKARLASCLDIKKILSQKALAPRAMTRGPGNAAACAPEERREPAVPQDAYCQVPMLAANGMSQAQIVQRLGLTRGEVELALKMGRQARAGARG